MAEQAKLPRARPFTALTELPRKAVRKRIRKQPDATPGGRRNKIPRAPHELPGTLGPNEEKPVPSNGPARLYKSMRRWPSVVDIKNFGMREVLENYHKCFSDLTEVLQ